MKAFSRAHLKELDALMRMALARARRAEGGGGGTSFVYQPGGVSHDNVYASWRPLIDAVNAVAGVRSILIDTTFAAATVPAGNWAISDAVQLFGLVPSTGFIPFLTFEDGAHLSCTSIYSESLILASASTTPVMTFAGGGGCTFVMVLGAIFGSASAPFFLAATDSGVFTLVALGAAEIGDGTNPVLEANGAANAAIEVLDQSLLFANATSGTGAVGVTFTPGATLSTASGFPLPSDQNVQPPQLAGLVPVNQSAQTPYWIGQQFLANLLAPATVIGVDAIQTADATPTDLPNLALGNASTPLPNNSSGTAELVVVVRKPSTGETVTWHAEAPFKKTAGIIRVGTVTNVGGNALALAGPTGGDDAAFAGTTIGIDIPTFDGIVPQVTGLVGTVIDWTVKVAYFYTHA